MLFVEWLVELMWVLNVWDEMWIVVYGMLFVLMMMVSGEGECGWCVEMDMMGEVCVFVDKLWGV